MNKQLTQLFYLIRVNIVFEQDSVLLLTLTLIGVHDGVHNVCSRPI